MLCRNCLKSLKNEHFIFAYFILFFFIFRDPFLLEVYSLTPRSPSKLCRPSYRAEITPMTTSDVSLISLERDFIDFLYLLFYSFLTLVVFSP